MRRFLGCLSVFLILAVSLSLCAYADTAGLSITADSNIGSGRLFYIHISCASEVRALRLTLRYDTDALEYRSIGGLSGGTSAKAKAQNGVISAIYVCDTPASGELLTIRMKALRACDTDVTVTVEEAVDTQLSYLDTDSASIRISITGAASSSAGKTRSSGTSRSSADPTEATDSPGGMTARLPHDAQTAHILRIVLFCAGGVLTAALLLSLGVIIGRKYRPRKGEQKKPDNNHTDI